MDVTNYLEELKKKAKNSLCLDFNSVLGDSLDEKVKTIYVCFSRMKSIAERDLEGIVLDHLVISPLMLAILEITNSLFEDSNACPFLIPELKYCGLAFNGKWKVLVHNKTYQEHHVLMCRLSNGEIDSSSEHLIKISFSNFVMSNMFGYYNM